MPQSVLLVDTVHPRFHSLMEAEGVQVIDGTNWSRDEILAQCGQFQGLVIRSRFRIDSSFLETCKGLRVIGRAGAGMENIDVAHATKKGIACINTPEGNRDAVAEHAMGMLLMLTNKLRTADAEVRSGLWRRAENRGTELNGKTIGLVGFGNMGKAFSTRLQGFGMRVLALDPYVQVDRSLFPWVEQSNEQNFFQECDIVSLHIPLTDETYQLVNKSWISRFSKPIWLINTARGKNVDTEALVDALREGKVIGAGLDVLESEAISFEHVEQKATSELMKYLIQSDRVVLTPHIAGWTFESHVKISVFLAEKMLPYLR